MIQASRSNILVKDDQLSGTAIFAPQGRRIGVIQRLYREAASGHFIFANIAVGGLLGFGT